MFKSTRRVHIALPEKMNQPLIKGVIFTCKSWKRGSKILFKFRVLSLSMVLLCLNGNGPSVSESKQAESSYNTCAYCMPQVCLLCVIVSFPGHAHFHFVYAELITFIPFLEVISTLACCDGITAPILTKLILKHIYVFSLLI